MEVVPVETSQSKHIVQLKKSLNVLL